MNRNESLALREERGALATKARELANTPNIDKEQRAQVAAMLSDCDLLELRIRAIEAEDASSLNSPERRNGAPPNSPVGADDKALYEVARDRHYAAWKNVMKYGLNRKETSAGKTIIGASEADRKILLEGRDGKPAASDEERRSLTFKEYVADPTEYRDMAGGGQGAYPGATTGFFIPVGFTQRVESALKYYGPMLNGGEGYPEIFDTATGQVLPFPTDNDTTVTGELVGEGQQVTINDVTISQLSLGAYKYSSKMVKISLELLQDSAFDLESWLIKKFATRLGRILNQHFTTGTGSSQPQGIVTGATAGYTAVGSASNDGSSASTNTIGSDDLIGLEHSVDPLYRPGAKWMFHDSTLRALKGMKDKYGRPLWLPGLAVKAPDTILNYEFLINNDMDTLQASVPNSPPTSKKTVLFGQLNKYLIRRVKEMSVQRLDERFADYGQVAFLMFCRYDGKLLDAGTNPVKYLTNTY